MDKADIEAALNLANIKPEWTYSNNADAWTMATVTSVTNAELPDYQGVSICVPGAYVKGVETDGDGAADVTNGSASESDISMFNSLNLQIAWLNAGTDAEIEWQWNGGHVPSDIFGDSLALYVDTMYGKYVDGAVQVSKAAAGQTANGTAAEAAGTDLTSWLSCNSTSCITMTLAGAANCRTSGASKAIPGFDVMDYGQEDYVFGSSAADARHVLRRSFRAPPIFFQKSLRPQSIFNLRLYHHNQERKDGDTYEKTYLGDLLYVCAHRLYCFYLARYFRFERDV